MTTTETTTETPIDSARTWSRADLQSYLRSSVASLPATPAAARRALRTASRSSQDRLTTLSTSATRAMTGPIDKIHESIKHAPAALATPANVLARELTKLPDRVRPATDRLAGGLETLSTWLEATLSVAD